MSVDIRDGVSDRLIRTVLAPRPDWVERIYVSGGGTHLLVENATWRQIAVLDTTSGHTVFETASRDREVAINASFSDGGRFLTVHQGATVQMFSIGRSRFEHVGFYDFRSLRGASVSPLVWVHFRERSGTLHLQYMNESRTALVVAPRGQRNFLEVASPSRPFVLRGLDNQFVAQAVSTILSDLSSMEPSYLTAAHSPIAVAGSPSGARFAIVTHDNSLDFWTNEDGRPRLISRTPTWGFGYRILAMPDDETVIAGSRINGALVRYRIGGVASGTGSAR